MPRATLTDISIRRLPKPVTGQVDWWDKSLHGFGVRCSCGGTKTFVLKQNNMRYTLGRVGITPLKQAREEARRRLALKYFPDISISTLKAAEQYMNIKEANVKRSTYEEIRRHLSRLPDQSLRTITALQLHSIIDKLSPGAANHAYTHIKTFLSWCVQRQYLQANPLQHARPPHKTKSRERVLSNDELRLIWHESYNHNSFGAIVRLLLLTGQRLNQIASLQRTWLTEDTIVFPAYIMKSNAEHVIPLAPLTVQNLPKKVDTPQPNLSNFLFPAPSGDKSFSSYSTATKKFRTALPSIPHFTLHDARRTFSTKMSEWNICSIDICEAILDHKTGSRTPIQRTYDRDKRLPQMRAALEAYETKLLALVTAPQHD